METKLVGKLDIDALTDSQKVKNKFRHDLLMRVVKILNAVLITAPFAACWYSYYAVCVVPFYRERSVLVIGLFVLFYIMFGKIYDAFLISMNRISEMIYSQCLAFLMSNGIMYIVIWLLSRDLPDISPLLVVSACQAVISAIWSLLAHKWYFAVFPPQPTMIVYDLRHGMTQLIDEYGLAKKYAVKAAVHVDECIDNLSILDSMETVFLSGVHSHERNIIIKYCIAKRINVFVIPRVGDVLMSSAHPMHMFHLPMLRLWRYMASPEYLFIKRVMDIVISLVALIVLSPVMLIVAIIIKATDGGPVFYKQVRLTKDGKKFNVLKFRSMRVDAEKDGVARLSTGDKDDRITPIGRFIRKCRLDEVPQFINILMGDMSVVGPRCERPEIAHEYEKQLPEFALRLQAKAGLTGYAQVYGKYNTTPYDKLQMDLLYIAHPSIAEDFKIIFATIKILFIPESTEGIAEGQTTAAVNDDAEHGKETL